jgi:hypothetical protein
MGASCPTSNSNPHSLLVTYDPDLYHYTPTPQVVHKVHKKMIYNKYIKASTIFFLTLLLSPEILDIISSKIFIIIIVNRHLQHRQEESGLAVQVRYKYRG